jgi:hypothetical protein
MEWKQGGGVIVCPCGRSHEHYFMAYWYGSSSVISERAKRGARAEEMTLAASCWPGERGRRWCTL